jgi:hypothetical protein
MNFVRRFEMEVKTNYGLDELVDRLWKFYQTPAPVSPRCGEAKRDFRVF